MLHALKQVSVEFEYSYLSALERASILRARQYYQIWFAATLKPPLLRGCRTPARSPNGGSWQLTRLSARVLARARFVSASFGLSLGLGIKTGITTRKNSSGYS